MMIFAESAFAAPCVLSFSLLASCQSFILWLLLLELLFADLPIVHLEEHACGRHESLLDTGARLRRSLKEAMQALLTSELLSFRC